MEVNGEQICCPSIVRSRSRIAVSSINKTLAVVDLSVLLVKHDCPSYYKGFKYVKYIDMYVLPIRDCIHSFDVIWGDTTAQRVRYAKVGSYRLIHNYASIPASYIVTAYFCSAPPPPNQACCDAIMKTISINPKPKDETVHSPTAVDIPLSDMEL